MKTKFVPSGWLGHDGRRLDCGPYVSGALEARVRLEELRARKDSLQEVTLRGMAGIFNGPRFARTYVDDARFGVPFLGSTDILNAELAGLPLLSRRQVEANPRLVVRAGWTLITCSGTIGRMAFARSEMDGMAGSQHFMRVVPDPERIPPGYLYAYLSSSFGVPLVLGGTYGAIIQHIEPEHIADLLVPRLSSRLEQEAHRLIDDSANARTRATELLAEAAAALSATLGLPRVRPRHEFPSPSVASVSMKLLRERSDAFYYSPLNADARGAFDRAQGDSVPIGEVAEVFIPGIFKRRYADDPRFGVPYITGADVFQLAPSSSQFLLKRVASEMGLVLRRGTIVIQEAGQLGGLMGRPVLVGEHLDGFACTNNMVRVTAKNAEDIGYLFAVLASAYGVRLVSREAAGSSIPHLEAARVRAIEIPWPAQSERLRIGSLVMNAQRLRDSACEMDTRARLLVEEAIERGAD